MNSDRRKELKNAYKSKAAIGGICCIRCSGNKRLLLQSTRDIESLKNRFAFAMSTKSCPDPSLYNEWVEYGADAFTFSVLEELNKREEQSDREFAEDIKVLYEMWQEKYRQGDLG